MAATHNLRNVYFTIALGLGVCVACSDDGDPEMISDDDRSLTPGGPGTTTISPTDTGGFGGNGGFGGTGGSGGSPGLGGSGGDVGFGGSGGSLGLGGGLGFGGASGGLGGGLEDLLAELDGAGGAAGGSAGFGGESF
jgi:hypothetical protein